MSNGRKVGTLKIQWKCYAFLHWMKRLHDFSEVDFPLCHTSKIKFLKMINVKFGLSTINRIENLKKSNRLCIVSKLRVRNRIIFT